MGNTKEEMVDRKEMEQKILMFSSLSSSLPFSLYLSLPEIRRVAEASGWWVEVGDVWLVASSSNSSISLRKTCDLVSS